MTTREELDKLSAHEFHDRAVHLARRRLDISFLWELRASREAPVEGLPRQHGGARWRWLARSSA